MRNTFLDHKNSKNTSMKKSILRICIEKGEQSIGCLSESLGASVPTVTKLISELMEVVMMPSSLQMAAVEIRYRSIPLSLGKSMVNRCTVFRPK